MVKRNCYQKFKLAASAGRHPVSEAAGFESKIYGPGVFIDAVFAKIENRSLDCGFWNHRPCPAFGCWMRIWISGFAINSEKWPLRSNMVIPLGLAP
jgi:hypothetical protein